MHKTFVRRLATALAVLLMTTIVAGWEATAAERDYPGRQSYAGEIDGAKYRVETPENWNGTLLLYSHGYAPAGFPADIATTNRPEPFGRPTEQWLLDHGYALAASAYTDPYGYFGGYAPDDQLALLEWFTDHVGRPEHTISSGQSLGGTTAVQLADQHPDQIDGVLTFCAGYDPLGQWNTALDLTFAIKTLLQPDRDVALVNPQNDAEAWEDTLSLQRAVDKAAETPAGRAKLALIGSFGNVTGWYSARYAEPATDEEFVAQQKEWVKNAYSFLGTLGRVDLEQKVGGNPSWNVGVDYTRQLVRSAQTDRVRRAYREAGTSLKSDLAALAAAPRITADQDAVQFMYRHGVQTGNMPVPMLTVHTTGDGGAVTDQERWYAGQVKRHGDSANLRNLYVHRGGHCTISAAEEITAVTALQRRLDSGTWPNLSPGTLNQASAALPRELQSVFDFSTFTDGQDTPRFTRFTPPKYLRPSR
jgi:pimeloyl-ACP methyl ester carboxylesterase